MVSLRQQDKRMVPGDEALTVLCVSSSGSKMRIGVPSLGAVLIGCHSWNMPAPQAPIKR
jgi:hypothetical protein